MLGRRLLAAPIRFKSPYRPNTVACQAATRARASCPYRARGYVLGIVKALHHADAEEPFPCVAKLHDEIGERLGVRNGHEFGTYNTAKVTQAGSCGRDSTLLVLVRQSVAISGIVRSVSRA